MRAKMFSDIHYCLIFAAFAVKTDYENSFFGFMPAEFDFEHALFYFGGVPGQIVLDCLKSAVTKGNKYESEAAL